MKSKMISTILCSALLSAGLMLTPQTTFAQEVKTESKIVVEPAFKKSIEMSEVNGVKVYLLPEDDEANEDGAVDQFWFMEQMINSTVPKGITIVDVRKAEKFNIEHVEGAVNVPFDSKTETLDTTKLPKEGIIVFYCNTGLKSIDARGSLSDEEALRVLTLDATYKCDDANKNCVLTTNEAI